MSKPPVIATAKPIAVVLSNSGIYGKNRTTTDYWLIFEKPDTSELLLFRIDVSNQDYRQGWT
jgi:hypothetical protein